MAIVDWKSVANWRGVATDLVEMHRDRLSKAEPDYELSDEECVANGELSISLAIRAADLARAPEDANV